MKYIFAILLVGLAGCVEQRDKSMVSDIDSEEVTEIVRIHDRQLGVVCYKYRNNRTGLSCVKLP